MVHEIRIGMDEAGNVHVAGPVENVILCYGLLEAAKDAIREAKRQRETQQVKIPPPGVAHGLLNGGHS